MRTSLNLPFPKQVVNKTPIHIPFRACANKCKMRNFLIARIMLRFPLADVGPVIHDLLGRTDGNGQDADGADAVVEEVVEGGIGGGVSGAPAVGFVVGVEGVDGSVYYYHYYHYCG